MTMQSMETSVALIDATLKRLVEDGVKAEHSWKAQYEAIERQNLTLMRIEHRLEKLEQWVNTSDPTIKQIVELKMQAQGAGKLGRIIWSIAIGSIGFVAGAIAYWQKWIGH